jgi:NAD-dependent DNA ligase
MPEKRSYYEEAAELNGMSAVDDVSKNLSLLVCASFNENGSKMNKAKKIGIKIIEIDEWLKSLKTLPSKAEEDDDDGQLSLF